MDFLNRKQQRFKETFSTNAGQATLASLLDFTGFYKQSFSTDPYQTAFNEGRRSVALEIIRHLDLREEDLRQLVRSYREELFAANDIDRGFNT